MADRVTIFRPYPFTLGQKIRIDAGPRAGDWEVIGLTDRHVRLRCPISLREVEWERFCYLVEESAEAEWPSGK